jgi:hypothetical protein
MKDNDWIPGAIIAGVIILAIGIGGIAYGIHKHNQSLTFVSEPSTNNASNTNPSEPPANSSSCVSADQAAANEGQNGCVEFVGYAYTASSGQIYLDESTSPPYGFSVWIPTGTSGGSSLVSEYSGKKIDVSGYIQDYKGEPEIEVTDSSQITLVQ